MKHPSSLITRLLAILACLFCPVAVFATNAVLTDDTTVSRQSTRAPSRPLPTLNVTATKTGITQKAYLKFDFSTLPDGSTGAQISKATLRLFCDTVTSPGLMNVVPVMSPWSEPTLSSINEPTLGPAEVAGIAVNLGTKYKWITVDITELVQDWVDGVLANNGVAIVPQFTLGVGGIVADFDSKENSITSHEPVLEITLVGTGQPGPQGPIGLTGPKGDTGSAGPQGPTGTVGAAGPQGAVGPAGPMRPVGPVGAKGDTGVVGPTGAKGDPGATGPQGPAGPKGDVGIQGLVGPAGAKGDTGAVGAVGPQGPVGLTGAAGPTGPKGDAGAVGPQGAVGQKGDVGAQGLVGSAGPVGPAGPVGAKGDTGAVGPQGLAGPVGAQGVAGPVGPQGLQGVAGDKGDQGNTGPAGPPALGGLTPARLGILRWYSVNNAYVSTSTGATSQPNGICFDGNYIWVTETAGNQINKIRLDGSIASSTSVAGSPQFCVSDGSYIWITRKTSNAVSKYNAVSVASHRANS